MLPAKAVGAVKDAGHVGARRTQKQHVLVPKSLQQVVIQVTHASNVCPLTARRTVNGVASAV